MSMSCAWFEDWFDTEYYHKLYRHRDEEEAERFITRLLELLKPETGSKVLDLACGRGRHSIYLNSLGLNVTGIDLSVKNIRYAKTFDNESLHFYVKDMRSSFGEEEFNIVFNLFTSFGYFEKEEDDVQVIRNISKALIPGGTVVIDFLNAEKIKKQDFKPEHTEEDNLHFHTHKFIQNNFIVKEIKIEDGNCEYAYSEKVKLIDKAWFEKHLPENKLKIQRVFGDYELGNFSSDSERLIIIATKNVKQAS